MACIATLNGINLPEQFSYTPLTIPKRASRIATFGAVVHQFAAPHHQIIGSQDIPWKCEFCTTCEVKVFSDLFDLDNPNFIYIFTGYWGEQYEVLFLEFEKTMSGGRLFSLSGSFTPIRIIDPIDMSQCCSAC